MNRITVSPVFRSILANKYPQLGKNSSYWLMLGYLMFSQFYDDETGKLIIPAETIAEIEGKQKEFASKNYSAERFLKAFSQKVHNIKWSRWDSREKKARVITTLVWDEDIAKAIHAERNGSWKVSGRVYLEDGKPFSVHRLQKYKEENRNKALSLMINAKDDHARALLYYLNYLPSNIFFKYLKNMPDAIKVAQALRKDSERQLDILNSLFDGYQPFYKPVDCSTRIYPLDQNMLCLQKNVRRALTKDWIEFDLRNAQIAIAARVWKIRSIQLFLETGQSFWAYLMRELGIEPNEEAKAILKKATYSIMYGGGKPGIIQLFKDIDLVENPEVLFYKFINLKLIHDLVQGRRKMYKNIGMFTYKERIELIDGRIMHFKFKSNVRSKIKNKRSMLAQMIQSYEMDLLKPVIEMAYQHKDKFTLTLWQHDGFSVLIHKPKTTSYWIQGLKMHVEAQASRLGIKTELEFVKSVE